ncbi:MAG TPA: ABC transporter permease, partial [Methylomirabilota bacterium]|nr:ABC transporter permease [Methylomirabilota bacterium]
MVGYFVRRVLWIVPVLFFVSIITFTMMHLAPGGPWDHEKRIPLGTQQHLNAIYGLNDPVPVQYLRWVGNFVHGDLGPSYKYTERDVNDIVGDGIGTTFHLGVMAFILSVLVGVTLGVVGALRHNKLP